MNYLSVAQTAKLLRAGLKAAFPGVKFSVISDSYAGGAAIRVSYADRNTSSTDVNNFVSAYERSSFDGSTDSVSLTGNVLSVGNEKFYSGADYVTVQNEERN